MAEDVAQDLDAAFVRGLPAEDRVAPSELAEDVRPLNIDGEWVRLTEVVREVGRGITLERVRPPTVDRLRALVAGQENRGVHFMGHGGREDGGALLLFENEHGGLAPVTARKLERRVRGHVFLVVLNACVSATPGSTEFSNLAGALVARETPYALGMQFSVDDADPRAFSRTLYSELGRGVGVEEAVRQTQLALEGSRRAWAVGVPVLYTALSEPAAGFAAAEGPAQVIEHQPPVEASALPRAEGTFQGRIGELKALGQALTGDARPRLLTIHGGGGQGKTVLDNAETLVEGVEAGDETALALAALIRERLGSGLASLLTRSRYHLECLEELALELGGGGGAARSAPPARCGGVV